MVITGGSKKRVQTRGRGGRFAKKPKVGEEDQPSTSFPTNEGRTTVERDDQPSTGISINEGTPFVLMGPPVARPVVGLIYNDISNDLQDSEAEAPLVLQVSGNFSQNASFFSDFSRNKTCTINAMLMCSLFKSGIDAFDITTGCLDHLLMVSDTIYTVIQERIIRNLFNNLSQESLQVRIANVDDYLSVDIVCAESSHHNIEFGGCNFLWNVYSSIGDNYWFMNQIFLNPHPELAKAEIIDLANTFFVQNECGVLTAASISVCVFRIMRVGSFSNLFGYYDSHEPLAVVKVFRSLDLMVENLLSCRFSNNLSGTPLSLENFNVSVVEQETLLNLVSNVNAITSTRISTTTKKTRKRSTSNSSDTIRRSKRIATRRGTNDSIESNDSHVSRILRGRTDSSVSNISFDIPILRNRADSSISIISVESESSVCRVLSDGILNINLDVPENFFNDDSVPLDSGPPAIIQPINVTDDDVLDDNVNCVDDCIDGAIAFTVGSMRPNTPPLRRFVRPTRRQGRPSLFQYKAVGDAISTKEVEYFSIGGMNFKCKSCNALLFKKEVGTSICCSNGKIILEGFEQSYPRLLSDLLMHNIPADSPHFHSMIMCYNSAMSFASIGEKNFENLHSHGPPVIKVLGQIKHRMTKNAVSSAYQASYGELYYLDALDALEVRTDRNNKLKNSLLNQLDEMLRDINPFAQAFKHLRELVDSGTPDVHIIFKNDYGNNQVHRGVMTHPNCDQVCAIMNEDGASNRDIVVHAKGNGGLQNIHLADPNREPLCYALLFPNGEPRWNINLRSLNEEHTRKVTYRQFAAYHFFTREYSVGRYFNPTLAAGKLTQQFMIDVGVSMDDMRVDYLRNPTFQKDVLRKDSYEELAAYIAKRAADLNVNPGGVKTVLPATHYGSDRWYLSKFRDAMAVQQNKGKPFLLITVTMNHCCEEVEKTLEEEWQRYGGAQSRTKFAATNRPDIISRVFKLKVDQIIKELEGGLFGTPDGLVYTVEWQKRGNPHVHIILSVPEDKRPPIDEIISAEIPSATDSPVLHDLVVKMMLHHYCQNDVNASCRKDSPGKACGKRFPKPYSEFTNDNVLGYPVYRRRKDGETVTDRRGNKLDNRYVVPYNPYLLMRYRCHINVEYVASTRAIGYLFKYAFKGQTKVNAHKEYINPHDNTLNIDEIDAYKKQRYLSAPQAIHRIFKFRLYYNYHTIIVLPVHLPGQNVVLYTDGDEANAVEHGALTKLTEFFTLMAEQRETLAQNEETVRKLQNPFDYFPRLDRRRIAEKLQDAMKELEKSQLYANLLYKDVAIYFTWWSKERKWVERKRDRKDKTLSRMHIAYPRQGERFYLRLLLSVRQGVTSFESLRTVNGVVHPTFQDTCFEMGLLSSDKVWETTIREVYESSLPHHTRPLFAYLLINSGVQCPKRLWEKCKSMLCADIEHAGRVPQNMVESVALFYIERYLQGNGKTLVDFSLPSAGVTEEDIMGWWQPEHISIASEYQYDPVEEVNKFETNYRLLNDEQRSVVDLVIRAINQDNDVQRLYCITGPGGVGKTLILTTLLHYTRGKGLTALATALSGLAASLLPGGTTLHSRFKLPFSNDNDANTIVCNVDRASANADIIRKATLIIFDEATMVPKDILDAVESLCRDLEPLSPLPFAGKVIVLCGDWRQSLPIVPQAGKDQIIDACFQKSLLWARFKSIKLSRNMRLQGNDLQFAKWLVDIGDGKYRDRYGGARYPDLVKIPKTLIPVGPIEDVIFGKSIKISDDVSSKVILSPKNEDVRKINDTIIGRLEGDIREYFSEDSVVCDANDRLNAELPVEDLHIINPSCFPIHRLKLKIGSMVILLRNLNLRGGLCNGTRLKVQELRQNSIKCVIVSGEYKNQIHFIPRIVHTTNVDLPFTLKRVQFPLALCYGMTITKAQGQSFDDVGVYLPSPVFAHGQLYVALSRTKYKDRLKVSVEDTDYQGMFGNNVVYTPNIVYKEVLK